jgi:hypothetical protein
VRVLLLALLLVPTTSEASFVYVDDLRSMHVVARSGCSDSDCLFTNNAQFSPAAPFADWIANETALGVTLSQSSSLGSATITASGSASTERVDCASCDHTGGRSSVQILFRVSHDTPFEITGTAPLFGVQLDAEPSDPYPDWFNATPVVALSGVLLASEVYRLAIAADVESRFGPRDASYDVTLRLLSVPEPATSALLALAVTALAACRGSRRWDSSKARLAPQSPSSSRAG